MPLGADLLGARLASINFRFMKPGALEAIGAQFFLKEHTAVILYNQVVIRYDLRVWDGAIAD